jgi:hypothetical protein
MTPYFPSFAALLRTCRLVDGVFVFPSDSFRNDEYGPAKVLPRIAESMMPSLIAIAQVASRDVFPGRIRFHWFVPTS